MMDKSEYYQYQQPPNESSDIATPTPRNKPQKWYCRTKNWCRMFIILILISILSLALIYNDITADLFLSFLSWMKDNILLGSIAFVFVYIICTILLIPGSILTLGAGYVYVSILNNTLFGVLTSTTIVWISASIGATFSFINGRYLLRKCVHKYTSSSTKFQIIEQVVQEYGCSVTFWLRLSSITPYNVFNYFMGITSIRLSDFVFANLGMIPDIAVYCFVGGSINEIVEIANEGIGSNIVFIIVLSVTLVVSIIGIILISYYAKKKFDKMVKEIKSRKSEYDKFDFEDDPSKTYSELRTLNPNKSLMEYATV